MILKNFIVFEGCDGSGTTTQRQLLSEKLGKIAPDGKKLNIYNTAEPTGAPTGLLLRDVLRGIVPALPETRAFLFAADRSEHLYGADGITEHSRRGDIIICDRYILSSLVYQGIECGDELPERLNKHFPAPQLLFYFDIDSETALKRIEGRQKKEIYEHLEFQLKVRERYRALLPRCAEAGSRVITVNAGAETAEVSRQIWSAVEKLPIFKP